MRFATSVGLRAFVLAGTLLLMTAGAAEKGPVSVGTTRDQVIAAYGEPRSVMVAGNREILWFAMERVVLRNGVVVEVERLSLGPVRQPSPPAAALATEAAREEASIAPADDGAPQSEAAADAETTEAPAAGVDAAAESPAVSTPPEPVFEIKSVRPPTGAYVRPAAMPKPAPEPAAPGVSRMKSTSGEPMPAGSVSERGFETISGRTNQDQPRGPDAAPDARPAEPALQDESQAMAGLPELAMKAAAPEAPPEPAEPVRTGTEAVVLEKARPGPGAPAAAAASPRAEESAFGTRLLIGLLATVVVGVALVAWRIRQRNLALAATAPSYAPFSAPARSGGGTAALFTSDLIEKLEWKRFEEMVASYFGKTGVVADRTKSGGAGPVHIKISWKGEPRPFACVHCISRPDSLIDVKPVQDLFDAIDAEGIRRGYVVSTGKFSVAARDFASEKHMTLMPGDILLEKINALPDQARAELMAEVTAGDYSTPSCPRCEAKMERPPDEPSVWRCPTHRDVTLPVRD